MESRLILNSCSQHIFLCLCFNLTTNPSIVAQSLIHCVSLYPFCLCLLIISLHFTSILIGLICNMLSICGMLLSKYANEIVIEAEISTCILF